MDLTKLSDEQTAALVRYTNQHGRCWKSALNNAWSTGIYSCGDNCSALQNVRNNLGPSWLARLNLRALIDEHAKRQSTARRA